MSSDPFHPLFWGPPLQSRMPLTVYVPVSDAFISALQRDAPNEADSTQLRQQFPETVAALEQAAQTLLETGDGADGFCPKLNGVMPSDAGWILAENRACCRSWAEAVLLLRASVRVGEAARPLSSQPPVLALQRWERIHPAYEFRSFISSGRVIAVCQRHPHTAYPFLTQERDQIVGAIAHFYLEAVQPLHPSLAECIMDCYLDEEKDVHLLDLEAWSDDALLLFRPDEMAELRDQVRIAVGSVWHQPDDDDDSVRSLRDDPMGTIWFRSVDEGFDPVPPLWLEALPLELQDEHLRPMVETRTSLHAPNSSIAL